MGTPETAILPWQETLWRQLQGILSSGRLGHALMLSGPAGLGKQVFARALGQSLLCAERSAGGFACGRCRSCAQFAAGTHPDYVKLEPEGGGRSIQIDAVREFSRQLHLTSQYRHGRAGLLHQAERLTMAAANSLLKTLEEPPAGSYLILTTNRAAAIPATIRSRCQLIRFQRPDAGTVRTWLTRQGVDPALIPQVENAPLLAMQRLDEGFRERRQGWVDGLMNLARDRTSTSAVAEAWIHDAPGGLFDWLYTCVLDMLRLRAGLSETELTNADNVANLKQLSAGIPGMELEGIARATIKARALAETQANLQLLLEALLTRWQQAWQTRVG